MSSFIRFYCPTCKAKMEAPVASANNKINCLKCGQRLQIPPVERAKTILAPGLGIYDDEQHQAATGITATPLADDGQRRPLSKLRALGRRLRAAGGVRLPSSRRKRILYLGVGIGIVAVCLAVALFVVVAFVATLNHAPSVEDVTFQVKKMIVEKTGMAVNEIKLVDKGIVDGKRLFTGTASVTERQHITGRLNLEVIIERGTIFLTFKP